LGKTVKLINWKSEQTHILLNPRWPAAELARMTQLAESKKFKSHIWLASSGSYNKKLIALSKEAMLASAVAVNEHLKITAQDNWLNVLPQFHVGGLGIYARAFVSGAAVHELSQWSPHEFIETIEKNNLTLSALVPTQVFDLIDVGFKAPLCLRAVVVGGAPLSQTQYQKARQLGWPLLPSFGMTECCSQIATAGVNSLRYFNYPDLQILNHCKLDSDIEKKLIIQSPALATGYFEILEDNPKWIEIEKGGLFQSEDVVEIMGTVLKPLGRGADFVKIGGESVSLFELRELLEKLTPPAWRQQVALTAVDSERLGHQLYLFTTPNVDAQVLKRTFDAKVAPYEKIREIKVIDEIPRSDLGKVLYQNLK
jgi:O-succinylbenzoic acid--CoA ligase